MSIQPPKGFAINHDDYHASRVGKTSDGRQFFITTPFVTALGTEGREFIALYLFDDAGRFLKAKIDDLGVRADMDRDLAQQMIQQRMQDLGDFQLCRIEIEPFEIERFGITFGFVLQPPDEGYDGWYVNIEPGDYMAFSEPWDSGEYET